MEIFRCRAALLPRLDHGEPGDLCFGGHEKKAPIVNQRIYVRLRSRPIQIWVPDTRSPGFIAEARRQAKLIAESTYEADDQAFIDSVSRSIFVEDRSALF